MTTSTRTRLLTSSFLCGALALGLAGQALAQDVPQTPPPTNADGSATNVEEVVVTGSRIPRAGYDTLQPAQVVSSQIIQDRAFNNVGDALNQLPTFGVPGASNIGDQSGFGVGANFVNFYGLGSQRTLTLVNGRRFVSSNPPTIFGPAAAGLQVDLNNIPIGLVERVEVVSIGGAPTYGADAIAGTVNIILKNNFEGMLAEATYGARTEDNDGKTYQIRGVIGGNFDGGRGNAVVSVEYDQNDGLLYTQSEFLRRGGTFQRTPACTAAGFGRCYYDNAKVAGLSYGGVPVAFDFLPNLAGAIMDANGNPLAFGVDGQLHPFNFGTSRGAVFSTGGDGVDLNELTTLVSPLTRTLIDGFAHYDLTPNVTAYVETFYAGTHATEIANQPTYNSYLFGGTSGSVALDINNPYLSDADRATISQSLAYWGGDPNTFYLQRANADLAPQTSSTDANTYRIVTGLKGDIEAGAGRTVNWDLSFNYGRTDAISRGFDIDNQAFAYAIDAVRDPVTNNIVCAVTLNPPPGADQFNSYVSGCKPLNLFGNGSRSQEALDYISVATLAHSLITQRDVQFNTNTTLFPIWAGDIKVAAGFEYRQEFAAFRVDGFTKEGLGRSAPINDLSGGYSSKEYYGETTVPLVSPEMNWAWMHSAELEGSIRYIDNSFAGESTVYTYGARIRPVQDLEIRGNITHSARAPAVTELFLPTATTFSFANDPCDVGFQNQNATRAANCAAEFGALGVDLGTFQSNVVNATAQGTTGGNPTLHNENAVSWTVGAVVRPRWVPGLIVAADWVDIHLREAITALSLTQVMQACYDSPQYPNNFCNLFKRDAKGQITTFSTPTLNAGELFFSGLQVNADYGFDLANMFKASGDLGRVNLQVAAFWQNELYTNILGSINDANGEIGSPEWKVNASVRYRKDRWMGFLQGRYQSSGAFNIQDTPTTRDHLSVSDYIVFDGALGYDITPNVTAELSVTNLFDVQPPQYSDASAFAPVAYDILGRFYNVTVRARF